MYFPPCTGLPSENSMDVQHRKLMRSAVDQAIFLMGVSSYWFFGSSIAENVHVDLAAT
jgi:hypothetical protein